MYSDLFYLNLKYCILYINIFYQTYNYKICNVSWNYFFIHISEFSNISLYYLRGHYTAICCLRHISA